MTRYIQLPSEPLTILSPDDDSKAASVDHRVLVRTLFKDQRLASAIDFCDLYDLRKKLLGTGIVELSEEEHAAISVVARRPGQMLNAAILSPDVQCFLKSIVDASSKKPDTP